MLSEALPLSGHVILRVMQPGQRHLAIREIRTCLKCGRPVVHWRFPGSNVSDPRCVGVDRQQCGAIRSARAEALQEAAVKAWQVTVRRRQKARQQKLPASFAGPSPSIEEDGPYAAWFELDRARRCPRPDKHWWHTLEAAALVVEQMRAGKRPRTASLNAYICRCGKAHVGNRIPSVKA